MEELSVLTVLVAPLKTIVLVPLDSTTLEPDVSQLPLAVQVLEDNAIVIVPAIAVTSTVANDATF